jgi:hypothetical protein
MRQRRLPSICSRQGAAPSLPSSVSRPKVGLHVERCDGVINELCGGTVGWGGRSPTLLIDVAAAFAIPIARPDATSCDLIGVFGIV